ncbi:P-loop containing nucleoside triphosphate hydrolase protein [Exidia glandulosa HHB12029]|uniref:p-loop containing nucleoside triphosphate hydrolase protein n=1 Tax=Exidia glandulosa HHB12029 TaxID=1314781 RepID=A0A165DZ23_EXIGL|nr:P-loop containing nucleoside triphosphate hydrolase protein [Exidia glandulosa HHB12029]
MDRHDQVLLVLCGLVGSGKSTFAQALERHRPDEWVRCCQDELKSRKNVERMARDALDAGQSPVIDRTNVSVAQRSTWISIAREYGVPVWLLFVNTPPETCATRVKSRRGHPTVKDGEGLWLIRQFGAQFEPPVAEEGFDRVLALTSLPQSPTAEETADILAQISTSSESTALVLSGPLPQLAKKKKVEMSHGRDIRSMFPVKSQELSRRRLLRGRSDPEPSGSGSGSTPRKR